MYATQPKPVVLQVATKNNPICFLFPSVIYGSDIPCTSLTWEY